MLRRLNVREVTMAIVIFRDMAANFNNNVISVAVPGVSSDLMDQHVESLLAIEF